MTLLSLSVLLLRAQASMQRTWSGGWVLFVAGLARVVGSAPAAMCLVFLSATWS